jgi:hypothetical protein
MVMRPRHALAAAAILTAVTLGSWAALSIDNREPPPQAAAPEAAPVTSTPVAPTTIKPDVPDGTTPNKPDDSKPRPCADHPAAVPSGAGRISSVAGDFDGDHARDQLLAYAKLDTAGQPSQWHVRVLLASGGRGGILAFAGGSSTVEPRCG